MGKKKRRNVEPVKPARRRLSSRWLILAIAAAAAFWYSSALVGHARGEIVLARLPKTPDVASQTPALARIVGETESALRAAPSGPGAGRLGQLYQANDYYDEAATCYELAKELDPKNPQWPYLLAYVLLMKGETGTVIEDLLRQTLELDPRYEPALLRSAENDCLMGNTEEALKDYRRRLELKPNDPYALLGIARIAVDRGQWEEAERCLKDALKADPGFGAAHRVSASVHGHFGRTEEQQQSLERATAAGRFLPAPDPWVDAVEEQCYKTDNLLVQAFAASKIAKTKKAQAIYERIISIEPNDAEAYWRLGTILLAQRQAARAEELFRKALELGVEDETRYPVIRNNLGQALVAQRRLGDAASEFQRALELDPDFELAHTNLGSVLVQQGHPEEAIKHCEKAVSLNPSSDGAQYNWGIALLKLGDAQAAAAHFSAATRLNPRLAAAHYQLGVFFERSGDHEQAVQCFRRALDTTSDRTLASRIRAILAQSGR